MLIKNRFITISAVLISGIFASSCKKYLNVNTNPNVAQNATVNLLLPSAEVYIASNMGVNFQINGGIWAQFWTQNPNSSQYRNLEQYQPTSSEYDRPWQNFYANAGEDLVQLDSVATKQSKKQYKAIALLLKAYTFQVVTDAWGDVPYTEALSGLQTQGHIVSPRYDPQRTVYMGILSLIDQGMALIDLADASKPGGDDLIFGGDMSAWQRFGNTLKLRVLLRMSEVDPGTAQSGISALYASSPAFLGDGGAVDDAQVSFTSVSGNKNPLYAEEVALGNTQNLVASSTCLDSMNADNDYRIGAFYTFTTSGQFVGIRQGDYNVNVSPGSYSTPTAAVGADATDPASATAPVKLLTGYESKFLQAEAVARGWATGDAAQLFADGITASFNTYSAAIEASLGVSGSDAAYIYMNGDSTSGTPPAYWAVFPTGGTIQQKLRHIITQKWFSMCGNEGFEAWTEWRRTGYPDFFVVSANSLIGNTFPVRFLYPDVEITRNAHFPGIKPVTQRVWWDVN